MTSNQTPFALLHHTATGLLIFGLVISCAACSQTARRSGMPAGAQTVLDASIEDIHAGRYEKLYQEAADGWRQSATLGQSESPLTPLHETLGNVRVRDSETAREELT